MPRFIDEMSRPNITPSVQGGVVDTTTAKTIQSLGEQAYQVGAGMAVSGLTGDAGSIDEVEADPSLVTATPGSSDEEQAKQFIQQVVNLDSLGKIAAARKAGSLPGAAANARAKVLLKKSLSDSGGLFANEIRQAFGGFFNSAIDGGGFFQDPTSPYDKAKAQFEEKVYTFAMEHGMSYDTALKRITARNNRQLQLDQITQTQALDAGNVIFLTEGTVVNFQETYQSRILKALSASDGGALTGEQARELRYGLRDSAKKSRREFLAVFQRAGKQPTRTQIEDFNVAMVKAQEEIEEIIDDNELQKVLKTQLETMSTTLDIENHKNLGNIIAFTRVFGEGGTKLLFDSFNSKQVKSFWENNELFRTMYGTAFPRGKLSQSAGTAALSFHNPENQEPNQFEIQSATPTAAEPRLFVNPAARAKLTAIIKETPAAFVYFANDKWSAAVEGGAYTLQDVEKFMKVGIEQRKNSYIMENNALLQSISIGEEVVGMRSILQGVDETTKLTVKDQNGQPVGSKVYTAVLDALRVARKHPGLWEGKYERPEDYVTSLFSIRKPTTAAKEEEASPKR